MCGQTWNFSSFIRDYFGGTQESSQEDFAKETKNPAEIGQKRTFLRSI
jgi:hypothetical protein